MADVPAVIATAATIVAALGGGGAIVAGLSNWLGRVWAERMMGEERAKHDQALAKLRADLAKQNADALEQLKAKNAENIEHLSAALELQKTKLLGAHADKLATYRSIIDMIVELIADRELERQLGIAHSTPELGAGQVTPEEILRRLDVWRRVEVGRIRAYAQLGLLAPQPVMDAYAALTDYFSDVSEGKETFTFARVRELGIALINEIRVDLGMDLGPIAYRGHRQ